jgi:hypothetical protein
MQRGHGFRDYVTFEHVLPPPNICMTFPLRKGSATAEMSSLQGLLLYIVLMHQKLMRMVCPLTCLLVLDNSKYALTSQRRSTEFRQFRSV